MHESATETRVDRPTDLLRELDRLEEKVQAVTGLIESLRREKGLLEQECERLRAERDSTIERLTGLIDKVDALRAGT